MVWVELFVAPLLDQDGRVGASYGFLMDISARKEAEASMRQALEEKSLLLRELYHRTKNNMGLIIGMLNLQSGQVDDPYLQEAFEDAENRIRSMAMVHQELYENQDLSHINLQSYTSKLVSSLITGLDLHGAKIRLKSYLEDIEVPIDVAIPCGLILNELVTNSLKHAFPGDREGELKVSISKLEDHSIEIIIGDDGIGFPAGFDPRKDGNVGLQTVIALAEGQLQGRIEYCDTESPAGNEAGTRKGEARNPAWRITLPDRHYHPRV